MLKEIIFALLGFSAFLYAQGNEKAKVTLNVKTKNLPEDARVFVTGNSEELGGWQPDKIELSKKGSDLWTKTFSINRGERLEFKFTLGSWEKEALNPDGSVPQNNVFTANFDTTINYKIDGWKNGRKTVTGKVTGSVEYHRNMTFEGINQRDIVVWLPPDYDAKVKKRFPVLYMHDGQNIVDPATSSFGADWGVDETSDSLIKNGKMKSIIVVGIYNTKDRTAEYSYTGLGRSYMKFIVEKLKPFIDSTYRTLPDRKNTATMGSSMGGLIALMLAWEHTDVFSMAACLSPAFKIQQFNYLPYITGYNGPKKKIRLYIDNGGIDLEAKLQPGIEQTIEALKEKGYKEGRELEVFFDKSAEHNERAWAKRLWRPLMFMFGKKA